MQIPVARIHLRAAQQSMVLKAEKLDKAIGRARRLGTIEPPILLRRTPDGYILLDGLYRLRAAQALDMERIPAIVE